jgi:hypothetical protein
MDFLVRLFKKFSDVFFRELEAFLPQFDAFLDLEKNQIASDYLKPESCSTDPFKIRLGYELCTIQRLYQATIFNFFVLRRYKTVPRGHQINTMDFEMVDKVLSVLSITDWLTKFIQ